MAWHVDGTATIVHHQDLVFRRDSRRTDLIAVGMVHKAKWSDLAISVALILALAAACASTPAAQRAVQTFDTVSFLVVINEVGLGMATEDMPAAQDTE